GSALFWIFDETRAVRARSLTAPASGLEAPASAAPLGLSPQAASDGSRGARTAPPPDPSRAIPTFPASELATLGRAELAEPQPPEPDPAEPEPAEVSKAARPRRAERTPSSAARTPSSAERRPEPRAAKD